MWMWQYNRVVIGKIIAGDLREITHCLYKVAVTRPWTRLVHCWEPDYDCHYIIPPFRSRPPELPHTYIYNKRNPIKTHNTNVYASAQLDKSKNHSVPYEQPLGGISAQANSMSTWLVAGGVKNPCQRHLYWAATHKKVSKVKPIPNVQSHSSHPIIVEASLDALGETHLPLSAHSRHSPHVPS
jgi:hypothetical protein